MEDMKTIITISIPDTDHMEFPLIFKQSKSHCVWLDWGDGSERDSFDQAGLIEVVHTYAEPGDYDIEMFAVDEGTIELLGVGNETGYRNMVANIVVGNDVTLVHANAFSACDNLEELTFLGDNTDIQEYAFADCGSLVEVALPKQLNILHPGVFFNCSSLKKVEMPETISTIAENVFYGCSQLKSIDLHTVDEIGMYAFHGCRKLTALDMGDSTRKIDEGAFDSCNSVRSIVLSKAEDIADFAFSNCRSVSRITLPSTVKTIGHGAFMNCGFLKMLKIEANKPPVLGSIDAFDGIDALVITVPKDAKKNYVKATNWNVFADQIEEEDAE